MFLGSEMSDSPVSNQLFTCADPQPLNPTLTGFSLTLPFRYRLLYKPLYKVAHKTVTELEWRCCPGFSGYSCVETHPSYRHPTKLMPPFKGPPMKGPPMFQGPPNAALKAGPWGRPKGPPSSSSNLYTMPHFGPPRSSPYIDSSFEPYPSEPEPLPEPMQEHQEPHPHPGHEQEHDHGLGQGAAEHPPEENPPPLPGADHPEGEMTGGSSFHSMQCIMLFLSFTVFFIHFFSYF